MPKSTLSISAEYPLVVKAVLSRDRDSRYIKLTRHFTLGNWMNVSEEGKRVHITWRSDDEEDVKMAGEFFAKLARQFWIAAKKDGGYKRVLEFKPEYEELWFFPLAEGG